MRLNHLDAPEVTVQGRKGRGVADEALALPDDLTPRQERKRRFKAGLLPAPLGFEVWGLGVGGVADESQRLELPALAALLRSSSSLSLSSLELSGAKVYEPEIRALMSLISRVCVRSSCLSLLIQAMRLELRDIVFCITQLWTREK